MRKKATIRKINFQIANEERSEYFLKMSPEDRLKYLQKLRKLNLGTQADDPNFLKLISNLNSGEVSYLVIDRYAVNFSD